MLLGRLLLHSIFKWYMQDDMLETMEALLEVILLKEVDLLLMVSLTSMSILDGNLAIFWDFRVDTGIGKCLFTSSLIGTTIQDGDTRERSNVHSTISKLVITKELLNILVRIQLVTLYQSLSNFLHHIYEGLKDRNTQDPFSS